MSPSATEMWHRSDTFEPADAPIVYFTGKGKAGTLRGIKHSWEWLVEKYNIRYWAYQSEVYLQIQEKALDLQE